MSDESPRPRVEVLEERVRALEEVEKELKESERRYRTIFQNWPVAMLEVDLSESRAYLEQLAGTGVSDLHAYFQEYPGKIADFVQRIQFLQLNPSALRIFEAESREEYMAHRLEIYTPETFRRLTAAAIDLWQDQGSVEFETPARTIQGRDLVVLLHLIVAPGHETSWSRVLVSIVDLTEKKRYQREMLKHQRLESIGLLAGGIAHDFNNLLTAILGNISLAQCDVAPGTPAGDAL